ncbi:metallophosphoesterase family protein [Parapedobacter lycopersici]|uniref:metallophosphoesterase family protein n=1 Tax=Parapedobacter lycopersici TaxID=1864939 RepID=UPI00214DC683|nr:metallophosphatase family protein [Parapedobacter lycopersici]
MKVLVISDVHGNLPAMEFVLKKEADSDLVISLGDVVNYGPWSNECVELLETIENKVLLKGNHEEAFIAGEYLGTHPVALAFFNFCYPKFKRTEKIEKYEQRYILSNFIFCHTILDAYIFEDTELSLDENYFIGHSHRIFERTINGFSLINVGSVGQSRVNIDEINYALFYPEGNKVELKRQSFSSNQLINQMEVDQYPQICIDYILSKRK